MKIARMIWGVAAFATLLLCGSGSSLAADWTLYYKDGIETHFYDKASIESPRKGIVWVNTKVSHLGDPDGRVKKLELSCNYHTFRVLSDKIDPVTGQYVPEGGAGGYKWTWVPFEAKLRALYENLCE